MTLSKFDEKLLEVNKELINMASTVEQAILDAVNALINKDRELAIKVKDGDDLVDEQEKRIETLCLNILLKHHPVARDLRFISSTLKIITDLERIGDQAADIAEISLNLMDVELIKELDDIPKMADGTIHMVKTSIDAFIRRDLDLVHEVIDYDDIIDDLFLKVKEDLIRYISMDAENGDQAMDLIMIAKYFERIGDHAENIAEWVLFSMTGKHRKK